jgi:short-subunit dehydrogenase
VKTALVTGATAGIGAAFARRLAADGYGLVIVARDGDRLTGTAATLGAAHGVPVETIVADLSTMEGQELVAVRVADGDRPIDLLVNNAGRSLNTAFLQSSPESEQALLNLNVQAVMRLTRAVLPVMVGRQSGAVINVSSVSGFGVPMPGSTYSASKAWVTNFTVAVGQSVAPSGVRLMALCPGYVRTEFHDRAGINMSKTPNFLWLDADRVVRLALRDLGRGKLVSVPDWKYKVAVFGMRHMPSGFIEGLARDTRGRIRRQDA